MAWSRHAGLEGPQQCGEQKYALLLPAATLAQPQQCTKSCLWFLIMHTPTFVGPSFA